MNQHWLEDDQNEFMNQTTYSQQNERMVLGRISITIDSRVEWASERIRGDYWTDENYFEREGGKSQSHGTDYLGMYIINIIHSFIHSFIH